MYGSEEEQSEAIPNNTSQDDLPICEQDFINQSQYLQNLQLM